MAAVGPGSDIDALVRELREEANVLRAKLGPTKLAPPRSQRQALEELGGDEAAASANGTMGTGTRSATSAELATMRALYDPRFADVYSHRPRLGFLIVALKRALIRMLTPVLDRQAAFNRAATQVSGAVEIALRSHDSALAELERRVAAAERSISELPSSVDTVTGSFGYFDFEQKFRGDSAHVRTALARYLAYFPGPESGPVLDLGCGRGEFLDLLRERGVPGSGIDRDPDMVTICRERGLDARAGDLIESLEAVPDASLGGVVSFQVVEHLPLAKLIQLIVAAKRKLRPGGCFIAETINPQSLITFARAWSIDPTHRHPVHPFTLRFLVESKGFTRAAIVYSGEVDPADRLEVDGGEDGGERPAARNAARLNSLLYAPQDYAVVAWA